MPLPVNFDVHTRSVHVVPMIITLTLVHIEARSAGHALALAEALVKTIRHTRSAWAGTVKRVATNPIAAVLISIVRIFFLLIFLPTKNVLSDFSFRPKKFGGKRENRTPDVSNSGGSRQG